VAAAPVEESSSLKRKLEIDDVPPSSGQITPPPAYEGPSETKKARIAAEEAMICSFKEGCTSCQS